MNNGKIAKKRYKMNNKIIRAFEEICSGKFTFDGNNWVHNPKHPKNSPKNPKYRDSRAQKNEKWRYIFRHITLQT